MKKQRLKYEREGFASQSAWHRARKKARGECLAHGCHNQTRAKIVDGKVSTYAYCAEHATRKSRGFE